MKAVFLPTADLIFSLLLVFLPLILGLLHAKLKKEKKINWIFIYYISIGIGVQGLASGIMQSFFSKDVSSYVHWPICPFMIELGLANISYGILGLMSPWMNRGWQTATAFGYALFLLFTGLRHAIEIAHDGLNPGDSGAFFYIDFIMSFILFVLLALMLTEKIEKKDLKDDSHLSRKP